jgi:hypothetical protein
MDAFNWIVFLRQISLSISIVMFLVGFMKRSSVFMFISFFASIPISYYFLGAENSWSYAVTISYFCMCIFKESEKEIGVVISSICK